MTTLEQLTRRARRIGVGALFASLLALTTPFAPDAAASPDANQCFSEQGADLNQLFGVPEQIINRFCLEATVGEQWRTMFPWIVSPEEGAVYPDGYAPLDPSPIEDFVAKLTSVRVVVDGGTRQEKAHVFAGADSVRQITFDQFEPGAPPLPTAIVLTPPIHPLSKGDHTREIIITLSALHCDGLEANVEMNCLPAGDSTLFPRPITFTTPEA